MHRKALYSKEKKGLIGVIIGVLVCFVGYGPIANCIGFIGEICPFGKSAKL